MLVLWTCWICCSCWTSVLSNPVWPLGGGTGKYEVVRPVKLPAVYRRDGQSVRPEVVGYRLRIGGKDVKLHLEKNRDLLAPGYSETCYTLNGTRVTSIAQDVDQCYYHGTISNKVDSTASISTCQGLRGYIEMGAQAYLIEPLTDSDTGDHALFPYENLHPGASVCQLANSTWESALPILTSRGRPPALESSIVQQQKHIKLYLVVDNSVYRRMNSDQKRVRRRMFDIVNFVNMVYRPLHTQIVLVGLDMWMNGDMIHMSAHIGETLESFVSWRNDVLMKITPHDNAQLVTGIEFEDNSAGLAYVGTMCEPRSAGVVQDTSADAINTGAMLAHELGHNLGMRHDGEGCTCSSNTCIMSAEVSSDVPTSFSTCSSSSYDAFLEMRSPNCILDEPTFGMAMSVCGNGVLEPGEDCDCGTRQDCNDLCCNAATCRLAEGTECMSGDCCENCKLLPAILECRMARDECDLPEYCTGRDPTCPEDVFAANGLPCQHGQGYCYNGQCPLHANQCVKMWGEAVEVANNSCYEFNTRGLASGFCHRDTSGGYVGCKEKDVMCGRLFCTNGSKLPRSGQPQQMDSCKTTFHSDPAQDQGQVEDGTKCGEGQVCMSSECVELEAAYRNTNCLANCPGRAVCNHRAECQCEPGWLLPLCSVQFERDDDGSLSRGDIIAIAVAAVAVTCLFAVLIPAGVMLLRRCTQKCPQAHSPLSWKKDPNNPGGSLSSPQVSTIDWDVTQGSPPPRQDAAVA